MKLIKFYLYLFKLIELMLNDLNKNLLLLYKLYYNSQNYCKIIYNRDMVSLLE